MRVSEFCIKTKRHTRRHNNTDMNQPRAVALMSTMQSWIVMNKLLKVFRDLPTFGRIRVFLKTVYSKRFLIRT